MKVGDYVISAKEINSVYTDEDQLPLGVVGGAETGRGHVRFCISWSAGVNSCRMSDPINLNTYFKDITATTEKELSMFEMMFGVKITANPINALEESK